MISRDWYEVCEEYPAFALPAYTRFLPGDTPAGLNQSGYPMVVSRDITSNIGEKGGLGIPEVREYRRLYQEGINGLWEIYHKRAPIGKTSKIRITQMWNSGSPGFELLKNVRMKNRVIKLHDYWNCIGKMRHF